MAVNKTQISYCSDQIPDWIRSDRITDRIGLAIRLKFKVTLKVILLVVVQLRGTRLKQIGVRRLLV